MPCRTMCTVCGFAALSHSYFIRLYINNNDIIYKKTPCHRKRIKQLLPAVYHHRLVLRLLYPNALPARNRPSANSTGCAVMGFCRRPCMMKKHLLYCCNLIHAACMTRKPVRAVRLETYPLIKRPSEKFRRPFLLPYYT
ncbi:hypothetical protein D0T90_03745 [Neisseria animalis]|uniref:Uncharacterized protein n=1 Tax=Neisseria animalis TaxID=492 RepID=A0A5P3MQ64_NEIAN|nr:hypothetical protein D0T90_03745 [Neisseria animalis]ROW32869.1 hypothetical protein CGZ60_03360 [Neisseria animalis]